MQTQSTPMSVTLKATTPRAALPPLSIPGPRKITRGVLLSERYRLCKPIALGKQAYLWEGVDTADQKAVRVRVFRIPGNRLNQLARMTRILEGLSSAAPSNESYMATFLTAGDIDKRNFLVFAAYGDSLRQIIERADLMPLPINQVKAIAHQVSSGINFLHTQKLIHTNIKPENIVLVDSSTSEITTFANRTFQTRLVLKTPIVRIVDYEHSEFTGVRRQYQVGTCEYRAPEITMGLPWSKPVDIFAMGCVIYELCTGTRLLHRTSDIVERLATIEKAVAPFPRQYVTAILPCDRYFFDGNPQPRVLFPASYHRINSADLRVKNTTVKAKSLQQFLIRCLAPAPADRIGASDAMAHTFIMSATHI
ncbi:hypothetical protein D9611_000664 [Ephemerocybe angulata]|uniref:Protein kinase domain-containing protein n=1 Tax=Ephemerocybe angulata TaxID=980116 RepID=A0A8H5BM74_9AGAR|nr:hypothetical protein D9611_000664 [Tulosesus angulatus]